FPGVVPESEQSFGAVFGRVCNGLMHRCALLGLVPVLFACGEKDGTSAVETTAGSTASDTASGPTTGGPATTGAAQTSSTGSSTSAGSTTSVTTVGNVAST